MWECGIGWCAGRDCSGGTGLSRRGLFVVKWSEARRQHERRRLFFHHDGDRFGRPHHHDRAPITDPRGTGVVVTDANGQPLQNPDTGDYVTVPSTTAPLAPTTTVPLGPDYVLQWKLAIDYRTHPSTNPFADYQNGPKVWSLREGSQRNGNYAALPQYSASFGSTGIGGWHDDTAGCYRTPAIAANTIGERKQVCTGEVPGNAAWAAPARRRWP